MSNNDVLNNAEIYEITLISHGGKQEDLSHIFNGFDIYESIHNHFLHGYLNITDTGDILNKFPIIGGETLIIAFGDNKSGSARFVDFTISGIEPQPDVCDDNNRNYFYTLKLTSKACIDSLNKRFSKRFNTTPSAIIQDLLDLTSETDAIKVVNTLSGVSDMDFIANQWNLQEIIDYICYKHGDMMFFETIDTYMLAKLSDLVTQNPSENLVHSNSLETVTRQDSVHLRTFTKYFDIENLALRGGFGQTSFGLKPDALAYKKEEKALTEIYDNEYPMMGNNQIFHNSLSNKLNQVVATFHDPELRNIRPLILNTLQNYQLSIRLNGNATRNVGQVITYNLPTPDNSVINENFTDTWLITHVRHSVGADKLYKQNIRLFKNAFFNNRRI